MEDKEQILEKVKSLAKYYGARKIVLFGSYWSDPNSANDMDLACDIPGLKLLSFAGSLESYMRMNIDVIPLEPTNSFVEYIETNGRTIYV